MKLEEYLLAAPALLRQDLQRLIEDAVRGADIHSDQVIQTDNEQTRNWIARYDRWNGLLAVLSSG